RDAGGRRRLPPDRAAGARPAAPAVAAEAVAGSAQAPAPRRDRPRPPPRPLSGPSPCSPSAGRIGAMTAPGDLPPAAVHGPFRSWSQPRTIDEHVDLLVTALSTRVLDSESVHMTEALHRVLLEDFSAPADLTHFDDSQMDGFAVSSAATPGTFDVVGMHPAGHAGEAVPEGAAAPIMTGAPVPPGADAVVPVEATDGFDAPTIQLDAVPAGQFVRHRGSDIRKGDRALVADAPLTAASLGVLAAFGLTEVQVRARPRVLIVAGGDEVAAPGETLGPGQLYDANTALLTAVLRSAGAAVVDSLVVSDTVEDFRVALSERVR